MIPTTRPAESPSTFRRPDGPDALDEFGVHEVEGEEAETTVGIPARTSRIGFTIVRTRGAAYSLR